MKSRFIFLVSYLELAISLRSPADFHLEMAFSNHKLGPLGVHCYSFDHRPFQWTEPGKPLPESSSGRRDHVTYCSCEGPLQANHPLDPASVQQFESVVSYSDL